MNIEVEFTIKVKTTKSLYHHEGQNSLDDLEEYERKSLDHAAQRAAEQLRDTIRVVARGVLDDDRSYFAYGNADVDFPVTYEAKVVK